jgi:hypothetical protein
MHGVAPGCFLKRVRKALIVNELRETLYLKRAEVIENKGVHFCAFLQRE